MKRQCNKRVTLISEDEELYKSVRRALAELRDIDVSLEEKNGDLKKHIKDKNIVVLFFGKSRDEIYNLLWSEIRIRFRLTNPVVFVGFHEINSAEDLRDLVFGKAKTSHRFLRIPFSIKDLANSIYDVKPLAKSELNHIVKNYCDWKGILEWILTHEIPNCIRVGVDKKAEIIKLYDAIKRVLGSFDRRRELEEIIRKIDGEIKNIEENLEVNGRGLELIENAREISEEIGGMDFNE